MSAVFEDFIPNDVATLRRRIWPIVQTAVAATAAWQISLSVLPTGAPSYAILAVVTGMNVHPGSRGKWMLQVALGAVLGVLIANGVGRLPAPVTVQILLALFLALGIGVLFYSQNWFLINAAAGAVIPIAKGSVASGFTFTLGWEALIACAVALVVTQLLVPADAAGLARSELALVLSGGAAALTTAAATLTGRAGTAPDRRGRPAAGIDESLDRTVASLLQALQQGRTITRTAPRRFSQRADVDRYTAAHPALADLADDLGGLVHLADRIVAEGTTDCVTGRAAGQLGEALGHLAGDVDDPARQDALARCAEELGRREAPRGTGSGRGQALALLLRDVADDALATTRALQGSPGR